MIVPFVKAAVYDQNSNLSSSRSKEATLYSQLVAVNIARSSLQSRLDTETILQQEPSRAYLQADKGYFAGDIMNSNGFSSCFFVCGRICTISGLMMGGALRTNVLFMSSAAFIPARFSPAFPACHTWS